MSFLEGNLGMIRLARTSFPFQAEAIYFFSPSDVGICLLVDSDRNKRKHEFLLPRGLLHLHDLPVPINPDRLDPDPTRPYFHIEKTSIYFT